MSITTTEVSTLTIRCASCSHSVGATVAPLKIVGVFKASMFPRIPPTRTDEVRKRCGSCGWVNVFHPIVLGTGRQIETK